MKHEKLITALWACLMSFIISMASVACLVTGFDMAVELSTVVLWCGIAALVSTLCYSLPLSLLPISAAALVGGYLWQEGSLKLSFQSLLFRISRRYNSVYGWGTIRLNMYTSDDMELTLWLGLCFLGVLIAMGVAWAVCRRKTGFVGTLPAILLLALCFVTTDTVPDTAWLYFLLFGVLLLMLTHTVRRADETQGNRLSFAAVLPLALGLLLLFAAEPKDSYTGQALAQDMETAVLENELVQAVFGDLTEKGTSGSSVDGSTVRLDHVGVRIESQAQILQVEADFSGILYLRGRAMDVYDGTKWTTGEKEYGGLYWDTEDELDALGEVTITTKYAHRMLYVPYHIPQLTTWAMTSGMENKNKQTQYSYTCYEANMEEYRDRTLEFDTGNYLHLPNSVKKWAEPLSSKITYGCDSTYEKAQAIAEYVRNSATYDLHTSKMPARETDFAKWFLEESDTGYCIHFATAATVLLQASGIPARYVTGYVAEVEAGGYTTVRSCDAHAWAEYWQPGFGWTILEATPAAQEETGETTPAEQTLPSSTGATAAPEEKAETDPLIFAFIGVGLVLAAMLALAVRCLILGSLRRKRLTQGALRQQALARWNELTRVARYLGEMPPPELLDIVQKAKFSQHTPTAEDLLKLDAYLSGGICRLKGRSVFHRLWYKVVLVLY